MENIILESSSNYERKYKCPYCEERYTKEKLVSHIEKEHADMTSENFPASRIMFNTVNKKDHGTCVICGKETKWNETVWRYNRFCSDSCKKQASDLAAANLMKAKGITKSQMLSDPDFQNKMLKNRSISGTYKFTTGGSLDYVGTYELKLLKFLDEIMGYTTLDIMAPGPTIPYTYNGVEHFWITDFYIIPYNLVIDVKDGGDNPNNREMVSYREKQECKEKAISSQGRYNYIRLTDNKFEQLLLIMAELKLRNIDTKESVKNKPIIKINESVICNTATEKLQYSNLDEYCDAVAHAVVGMGDTGSAYIVPYVKKDTFETKYAISDDPSLDHILINDDFGNVIPKGYNFLETECESYELYKFDNACKKNLSNPSNLIEAVTGKKILDKNQLDIDESFAKIMTPKEKEIMQEECVMSSLLRSKFAIPTMVENYDENVMFYEDENGYFVENVLNSFRSKSYNSLSVIPEVVINYISKGEV